VREESSASAWLQQDVNGSAIYTRSTCWGKRDRGCYPIAAGTTSRPRPRIDPRKLRCKNLTNRSLCGPTIRNDLRKRSQGCHAALRNWSIYAKNPPTIQIPVLIALLHPDPINREGCLQWRPFLLTKAALFHAYRKVGRRRIDNMNMSEPAASAALAGYMFGVSWLPTVTGTSTVVARKTMAGVRPLSIPKRSTTRLMRC
jgi:hypothetical protein